MKDLLPVILIFIFSFILLCNLKESNYKKEKPIDLQETKKQIETISLNKKILLSINQKKSLIRRIKVNSLVVNNKIGVLNINSSGFLTYEKDKNFRFVLNSIFGKEVDIGSNNTYFWYWSKRSTDKSLFFSSYENIKNTRLKDPVNPLILKSILFIDNLPIENTQIYESENYFFIEWEIESINDNEKMLCCMKIDKKTYQPYNMTLKNSKNKLISEIIVQNVFKYKDSYLAQKIKVNWPDENIEMTWILKDIEINNSISSSYWKMPNHDPKINIGIN